MRYSLKNVRTCKLAYLLLIALLLLFFLSGPYINIAAEDLQTFLCPVLVFACWGLFRALNKRLIDAVAAVTAIVWMIGAGSTRAAYPFGFVLPGAYLSRLENDADGMAARQFQRAYNLVAERTELPQLRLLQRSFSSAAAAHQWHQGKFNLSLLLSGSSSGISVSLPEDTWPAGKSPQEEESLKSLLALYDIASSPHLRVVILGAQQEKFLLVGGIDQVNFSMQSASAAVSFLPWFAEGFARSNLQEKQVAFGTATQMLGPWRSGAVLGAAYFYLALADFLDAERYNFTPRTQLDCVKGLLQRAAGYTAQANEPEVTSAIFNNSAVVRLLIAYRDRHFDTVRKHLAHAAAVVDAKGQPVLGAKVAMVNLILLDRLGVTPP